MHGLVGKLIQCFVEDTYDPKLWEVIARESDLGFRDFEAMLVYQDDLTYRALSETALVLGKSEDAVLEDIGSYLVSHDNMATVRRLLRFGGLTFEDFLHSLDDLPDRVRMAIPDLEMPEMFLREYTAHLHSLTCVWRKPGFGSLMIGLLRALADDYGALVLLDMVRDSKKGQVNEVLTIELLEVDFTSGRSFSLAASGAA